jgi:DNA-binding NtrC family response regulator
MGKIPGAVPDYGLVGRSPQIAEVRRLIGKAALSRLPVLLLGESGTGKEVVARAIHQANPRGKLVPIDCGSLVPTLMESELFGHVKGAFSGAVDVKKGLVEEANGGTAFFDEIGDLPFEMQVKLLRLVQEGQYRQVGSLHWKTVDLRIIAATHRDLKAEVAANRFRLDLYYRLNVLSIGLPPLRERKEDIPLLVEAFARNAPDLRIPDILDRFASYDWPGNVRELKHCVDRILALRSEGALRMSDMPSALQNHLRASDIHALAESVDAPLETLPRFHSISSPPIVSIPDSEKRAISAALAATNGERGTAARLLKISRTTLYRRMKEYKLIEDRTGCNV